jgi:hypothetical protein
VGTLKLFVQQFFSDVITFFFHSLCLVLGFFSCCVFVGIPVSEYFGISSFLKHVLLECMRAATQWGNLRFTIRIPVFCISMAFVHNDVSADAVALVYVYITSSNI